MANDKPRFIRKNGKIIPIGGKKKGGSRGSKKRVKAKQRKQATKLAVGAGATGGLAAASNLAALSKNRKLSKFSIGLMGVSAGLGLGSLVQNVKGSESFLGGVGNIALDSVARTGVAVATAGASLYAGSKLKKLAAAKKRIRKSSTGF